MVKNSEITTPESRVRSYQIALLGVDCVLWSEETSVKLRLKYTNQADQLSKVIARLSADLDKLELGETRLPKVVQGEDESDADHKARTEFENQQWLANEVQRISMAIAANVATLERLTSIWLKITAGGAGALVASLTKTVLLGREMQSSMRDATPPRRRMAAGAAQVIDEEQSSDDSDDTD